MVAERGKKQFSATVQPEKAAAGQQILSLFPTQREVEQRGASSAPSHARASSSCGHTSLDLGELSLLRREHGDTEAAGMRWQAEDKGASIRG